MSDLESAPISLILVCPLRSGETLHELRVEATCQTTNGETISPRSEPDIFTVPEPAHGLLIGALFLAILTQRKNRR